MTTSPTPTHPTHQRIEEWLNSATHGIGALLSVIGTIALIVGGSACHFSAIYFGVLPYAA
ncbi:MAG: hemolysin III [Marinobacter maritimus]|jgi:hemolysin III|uniref:hypothetical protein n=1 Tax=Marinobacter maritimus TaxID=277961 RepID=UPI001EB3CF1E|nr:hypothetical protein [Marinobacter maritimus]MBL1271020.1 hypothetical protein [Oceanospirillales bacterium]|tara:strand:+ start:612 stop:791 length:180 start_codon:yes stop_codon:yes gene_type:complete